MGDDLDTCKVVLVGETSVGKTSIIKQFLEQTFLEDSTATIGATFSSALISINGKKEKFTIWDTAGQEKYRALIKMFYKDAFAAVLVYDITKALSFTELKSYWYKELADNCPENLVFAIAANKADLYEHEAVDEKEARAYAEKINAIYVKTSALNAEGIDTLFLQIGEKYANFKGTGPRTKIDIKKPIPEEFVMDKNGKKVEKDKKCCK